MEKDIRPHSFSYDNGTITVTGIIGVKEFGESEVSALLPSSSLIINGSSLTITDLNVDAGILKVSGELTGLRYGNGSIGFFKRLLK